MNPSGTIPVLPPTTAFAGDTITVTASGNTGKVVFTASAPNATNVITELLLQPLKGRNRVPSPEGYRSKAYYQFISAALTKDVTVPTGFYAAGYRFVSTVTGQMTDIIPLPIQAVALSVSGSDKKAA